MTTSIIARSFLVVAIFTGTSSLAQKASNAATSAWRKTVSREITIPEKTDNKKHHLHDLSNDTSFFEMMMNAVRSGRLTAYSNFDNRFTEKQTIAQITEMMVGKPDTITTVDPVSKQEAMKVIMRDVDFESIHKYRVLEEWSYNRQSGKTDIQITGIAPIQDIYGDAGDFRGSRALFWIKYYDIAPMLDQYEETHPGKSLPSYIWNDYFLSDIKPG